MLEQEVNFLDYFKEIKDPRINRKKLYPLDEIFLVTISGMICGAERLDRFGTVWKEEVRVFKDN